MVSLKTSSDGQARDISEVRSDLEGQKSLNVNQETALHTVAEKLTSHWRSIEELGKGLEEAKQELKSNREKCDQRDHRLTTLEGAKDAMRRAKLQSMIALALAVIAIIAVVVPMVV